MSSFQVDKGDMLVIHFEPPGDLKTRCPEVWQELTECAGFVNYRRIEKGLEAILALSYYVYL